MIFFVIFLVIFLWFGGYLITTGNLLKTGVYTDEEEKMIMPPKWLYYACGAPKSKNHPKGVLSVVAFRTQMQGVFLGLCLILYMILRPPFFQTAMGFLLFALIPFPLTAYISKRYTEKNPTL